MVVISQRNPVTIRQNMVQVWSWVRRILSVLRKKKKNHQQTQTSKKQDKSLVTSASSEHRIVPGLCFCAPFPGVADRNEFTADYSL